MLSHQEWHYLRRNKRGGLVGVERSTSLGVGLWGFKSTSQAQYLSLPASCSSRCRTMSYFSSTISPVCHQVSHHDDNESRSQSQLNASLYKNYHGPGLSSQQQNTDHDKNQVCTAHRVLETLCGWEWGTESTGSCTATMLFLLLELPFPN